MGLFSRKKEKRSDEGTVGFADALLTALIGGGSKVTKAQAMQIPTVAACITLIADRIAALPIKLYRKEAEKVNEILDDNRIRLLNGDTGDTLNATEMRKRWVRDYFLGKGAYTYIHRTVTNEITGIYYVDETDISVLANVDPIFKDYKISVNGRSYFNYEFIKILRNSKGLGTGTSIIAENPLALAVYYNTMKFENANIRKGGNKRGFLKAASKLSKPALEELKEAWKKLYSNSDDKEDNIVLLNDGVDFKESSSTSVELQLNENKQTNAAELCKLFCMPMSVLNGTADKAAISQFVQNCLMPVINTIEAALDHDFLTENEKTDMYWAFDTTELTRGDFAERMNAYAVAYQNNFYQLDEIREREDLPPLGFNFIKLGLDAVLVDPKTMDIYTPNTGKLEKMNAEHLTDEQLRAILEERYNPYHDPVTGQFTTGNMAGWSSGAALVVEKGEKGAGKYVFNSELTNNNQTDAKLSKPSGGTSSGLIDEMSSAGVAFNPVQKLTKPLTEQEIIQKIGGGDMTSGSCASLAMAYAANKAGYDVTDYRGGKSHDIMAGHAGDLIIASDIRAKTISSAFRNNGEADYSVENRFMSVRRSGVKAAQSVLTNAEDGKEYILLVGKHGSIVRKKGDSFEYLELQERSELNGWKALNTRALNDRFEATKTRGKTAYDTKQALLGEISEITRTIDFEKAMGYINTATDNQKKGDQGYAK